jgi:RNA polymerase sigma factor (sigma-70 family)
MAKNTENYTKLTRFFGTEYNALKHYIRSKINDSAERDAEDILQDVAFNLYSRVDQLTPIHNIAGFVYRSLSNKIIDIMRSRKERGTLEESTEATLAELYFGDSPYAEREELYSSLRRALLELRPEYMEVITAIDFEGQSYRDLSSSTGVPQGTLMSRRHRALSFLAKAMETNTLTTKTE